MRHSRTRDKEAIHHHYDVSNAFYEYVLGPSMTYTCAVYPTDDATLEQAQHYKYDLVARKLDLKPGMRLLDVGCGWGGMVRHAAQHYGVKALGVTLSREQATWAQEKIKEMGLDHLAEVRHSDYREVTESGFDAVSSIGLTEHIGVRNYPAYFGFLRDRMRPEARLLNHCITRPHNKHQETGAFIDRYVFPDGELIGSGKIITEVQNAGLEVQHEENFRLHYARTLAGWCRNLEENWDACVAEVGEGTARVWGLYMAGSRLAFERNEIQLHHVLATKTDDAGPRRLPAAADLRRGRDVPGLTGTGPSRSPSPGGVGRVRRSRWRWRRRRSRRQTATIARAYSGAGDLVDDVVLAAVQQGEAHRERVAGQQRLLPPALAEPEEAGRQGRVRRVQRRHGGDRIDEVLPLAEDAADHVQPDQVEALGGVATDVGPGKTPPLSASQGGAIG